MVQQVEEQHIEEEERFRKLQVQDAASLNDRMDTLIVNKCILNSNSIKNEFYLKKNLDERCGIIKS